MWIQIILSAEWAFQVIVRVDKVLQFSKIDSIINSLTKNQMHSGK